MLKALFLVCLISIFADSSGDLSFLTDLPRALKNTSDAFFGTIFGRDENQSDYVQNNTKRGESSRGGVGQKVVDAQGDGNVNQNVNVNLNNGTLVLLKPEDLAGQVQGNNSKSSN